MIVQVKAFNLGEWLDGALAFGLTTRAGEAAGESDGLLGEVVGECDELIGEVFNLNHCNLWAPCLFMVIKNWIGEEKLDSQIEIKYKEKVELTHS